MQTDVKPFPVPASLARLHAVLSRLHGRAFVVGGAVRDHHLGLSPKDYDVEVYDVPSRELGVGLRAALFDVDSVGASFGVLKVRVDGDVYDVSLPRTESKTGSGHRAFEVEADESLSFAKAASRRDFTINAIGYSLDAQQFVDPHGGLADLALRRLKHVSDAFGEDPLRVLRGCQFASRFDFTMAPETVEKCKTLVSELTTLPVERLWVEWVKLLMGAKPSRGLDLLVDTGAIKAFPEVEALLNVPQEPEWHPEDGPHGSLWAHNCMVTDSARRVLNDDGLTDHHEQLLVMMGAFCHDFGKPSTTEKLDGRWRSLRHEQAGEAPTRSFLTRIGAPPDFIEQVVPLVQEHLKPFHLARDKAGSSAIRRLANRVPLERLCRVARADFLGRTTADALACLDSRTIAETTWLLEKASTLNVRNAAAGVPPILLGRHLLALGMKPGREVGTVLKAAHEAQLDGVFDDEDGAVAWAARHVDALAAARSEQVTGM